MNTARGLNGAHFEALIEHFHLDEVIALAASALDNRDLPQDVEPVLSVAPTVRSPRGIVAPLAPIYVVVAA